MPVHSFARPLGRVVEIVVESDLLADNLLGDPAARVVSVYLPEGYDESPDRLYPLFVDLVGFTGSGFSHVGWKAFSESVPQRVDRLIAEGRMGPVIVALPDAFTSLGGNQYIDSVAMGAWGRWLTEAMLPALEARFRVRPGRAGRAVFGKSSGGFGAISHGALYAEHWGAVACHSGDMGFDRLFLGDLPKTLDALARRGGLAGFLEHVRRAPRMEGKDLHVLMVLAMGATYDPDPEAPCGIRLPVDHRTGVLDPVRWAAWLSHDPVVLIERRDVQESLRSLRGLWVDVGSRDQYAIHYGTRQLVDRLAALGIPHTYEEFDGTHSSIDYRMDRSLPFLFEALGG